MNKMAQKYTNNEWCGEGEWGVNPCLKDMGHSAELKQ